MRLASRFASNAASVFEHAVSAIFWDKNSVPAIHLLRVSASATIVSRACLVLRNARARKAKIQFSERVPFFITVNDDFNASIGSSVGFRIIFQSIFQ